MVVSILFTYTNHVSAEKKGRGPLVRLSVRPPVRPPARPSARPSVRPSVRPPVRPCACPPDRPSVRPPDRPSVRPPARLSVRPSTRLSDGYYVGDISYPMSNIKKYIWNGRLVPFRAVAAVCHRRRRHAGWFGLLPASGLGGRISKPTGLSWAGAYAVSAVDMFLYFIIPSS